MPRLNFGDGAIAPTNAELTPSNLFAQSGLCRSNGDFVTNANFPVGFVRFRATCPHHSLSFSLLVKT